jgi:ATP-dependent Lon protease
MKMSKLPDGRVKILIQGLSKARVIDFVQVDPYRALIEKIEEPAVTDILLKLRP